VLLPRETIEYGCVLNVLSERTLNRISEWQGHGRWLNQGCRGLNLSWKTQRASGKNLSGVVRDLSPSKEGRKVPCLLNLAIFWLITFMIYLLLYVYSLCFSAPSSQSMPSLIRRHGWHRKNPCQCAWWPDFASGCIFCGRCFRFRLTLLVRYSPLRYLKLKIVQLKLNRDSRPKASDVSMETVREGGWALRRHHRCR
jgi:hypothetical protein